MSNNKQHDDYAYLKLVGKLDLEAFVERFNTFLAREKPLFLEGDTNIHIRFIKELDTLQFTPPKEVKNLQSQLMSIKKFGVLKIYEIFEFIKIIRYFLYLKSLKIEGLLGRWIEGINTPEQILEIEKRFDEKGVIRRGIYEEIDNLEDSLKRIRGNISEQLHRTLSSNKLAPYFVDRQIHLINDEEVLLLRGGFNHFLKGSVIGRSSGGFFYVLPDSISKLKEKESELLSLKEELLFKICKEISGIFQKHFLFLRFIDKEFDRFDHYQARALFAKAYNYEIVKPAQDDKIVLKDFRHPALAKPKSISIEFDKRILMITGVNAGGKTMLLKSILSAVLLAKYLIPFGIDSEKSHIGTFKSIEAILDDPQNVKNDISTFAGRVLAFSELFVKNSMIVGVDEIELGTDSDEAASLFKVILEKLILRDTKIIITTHHKRLAALMAGHRDVELVAALYDEQLQMPTFSFLQGTIGKSYAFETAERYGIPKAIVNEARAVYGDDKERLNELIEKSAKLEMDLQLKKEQLESEIAVVENLKYDLETQKEQRRVALQRELYRLEGEYRVAIEEAKRAAKANDLKEIHKFINNANKRVATIAIEEEQAEPIEFKVGDRVKHGKTKGVIISLTSKDATIETEQSIKLRVKKSELKRSGNPPKPKPKVAKVERNRPDSASVKIDLHGLRSEEAIERLDKFLSDSLLAGFDEVLVYHGIGTGRLAHAVKEFLSEHPKVVEYLDAPPQMGGFGAKIIKL